VPALQLIPIHVVGIGLDGAASLSDEVRRLVEQATLLVGSARHLSYFPEPDGNLSAEPRQARLCLGDLTVAIAQIRSYATTFPFAPDVPTSIAILASGDPLFFGLGRLLLAEFPAEQLTFHPHLSAIQLAFSRIKLPWQDARVISAHGRSLEPLTQALQQGTEKIAVLTDGTNTPGAIFRLVQSLDLPTAYQFWVCENLGGADERIVLWDGGWKFGANNPSPIHEASFAPLNVVVLQRLAGDRQPLNLDTLPILGIPDACFLSFPDRPGLMTKREVRVQILAEMALQPSQVIWDVGAGTGSVSIELARLCPNSQIYAIEKTAIGSALITQNCERFQVRNVTSVHGSAPQALLDLPSPDRIFIGGSGGNVTQILDVCGSRLRSGGRMVLALATLEHLTATLHWLTQPAAGSHENRWQYRLLQVQLARSVPIADLTRLTPLNPVTLVAIDPGV